MAQKRVLTSIGRLLAAWLAITALTAAEHHGTVKSGGLPIPGASVTATKGDQKLVTTTDENGRYTFANLPDGTWRIDVDMLGFAKLSNEVGVAFDSPGAEWNLTFLSMSAILAPKPAPPAPTVPLAPSSAAAVKPAITPAAAPNTASTAAPTTPPTGRSARGSGSNGGRPSLAGGFTRLNVNSSGDAGPAGPDAALGTNELADLSGSADPALLVNGSVSRGLDMPQQNDWTGGMGRGGDGFGGVGPMGMTSQDGMPGINAGGGGRGGPGGPGGGGFGGGPGGPGGGFGGGRGAGGMGGGRGGRGGQGGRPGAASFGNGRRDRRMQYTGNLAFTLDNSIWDARSYSVNGLDTAKPAYAQARATMMLGGPLKIPHLLSGQKGMFTLNYQLRRTRSASTITQTVPTLLERNGDFSQSVGGQGLVTIFDPLTGSPFPNNVIPQSRVNPIATSLLNFYPLPNAPGYKNNYQTALTTINNLDNINSRLNQTITKNDRLSGGLGYQGSNSTTPNIFNFIDHGSGRSINANVAWGHNFTTKLINNLRYSYSRSRSTASPFFANNTNLEAELGIAGVSQLPQNWGPPTLSFANYAGLSDGSASLTRNQMSGVGDSVIWIHGLHNITAGADYRRQQYNPESDPNARGQFTFTGLSTADVVNNKAAANTGFDLADFLLGRADTTALRYNTDGDSLYLRTHAYDIYATDDWRITPKLSLNFGLRWDYQVPITELYNRLANLDVAPGYAADPRVIPGQAGPYAGSLPDSLVRPDKHDISPRIGFAWRPGTKANTVVRGGYGIYYNTSIYNNIAGNMAQQPPYAQSFTVASSGLPANLGLGQYLTYISSQDQVTNTYAVDPNYKTGYAQIWQLAVQNDLGHSLVATITYNGTKGTRLDQTILPNTAPSGGKPNGLPSGYIYEESNGNSIYHGISGQLQRRFRSGISATAIYTYSKAIDNAVRAQDFSDTSAERAISNTSRPNVLNFNWQYSTGVGRNGGTLIGGWKGALIKDWTFTQAYVIGSGLPLTPTVGGVNSTTAGTGITGALRANATGLPVTDAPPGEPFNFAAFAAPPPGQWGNAGRNSIEGPREFSLNASAGRTFRIGERRSIDLRFDATNMLNHVTFNQFNTTIGSNNLGLLQNANAMRSMTATLRFRF